MVDSKNAAISGVDIYKVGLHLSVFTLTPFIYLGGNRCHSTIATPPNVATDATTRRKVSGSESNNTPPMAAIAGTDSCTVAALVAASPRSAAYQIT